MSKFKFVLNRAGVRQLMQSDEMQALLKDEASAIANRCGPGYEQDIYVGKTEPLWCGRTALKPNEIIYITLY